MKVGLYPRVSTQEQAKEGYSISEQIERLEKYCDAMNWEVYKTYTDPGFSGGDMNRPGLQEMIEDVKNGKLDKIVVYKLDRLSRSQLDTLYLIEKVFLANKVDFVSMSENFDTGTPFGRAMIGILAVFAQLEREQIKERMSIGREGRAKEGKWHGGSTSPIGYDYVPEDDMLYINEYEQMQILEAYSLFLNGSPLRSIERAFSEKGYRHKYGIWDTKVLRRVMTNPVNIGIIKWEDKEYPGLHKALVDKDTFYKAVQLSEARKEEWKGKGKRNGYYASYMGGRCKCKNCGAMYHMIQDRKNKQGIPYRRYSCYSRSKKCRKMIIDPNCKNKNWRMDELDNLVFDEIRNLATDPSSISDIRGDKAAETPDKIKVLQKQIDRLKGQKSRFMQLFSLDEITMDEVQAEVAPINEQIKKMEADILSLKENEAKLSEEETFQIASNFEDILARGNFDEIRMTLDTLIDYIEMDGEDITIHWNFV